MHCAAGFVAFVEEHSTGRCALAAHNGASLDFKFLLRTLERAKLPLAPACAHAVDTLPLAKHASKNGLWGKQLANNKLGTLFKHVTGRDIENAHDATADTLALVRVMSCDVMQGLLLTRVMLWEKFVEREHAIEAMRTQLDRQMETNGDVARDEEDPEDVVDDGVVLAGSDDGDDDSNSASDSDTEQKDTASEWEDVTSPIVRSPSDLFLATGITPGARCRRHFSTALGAFDRLFSGIQKLLVRQTNLYAKQKHAARVIKAFLSFCVQRSRGMGEPSWVWKPSGRGWFPVTNHHIRVWLACGLQRAFVTCVTETEQFSCADIMQPKTFCKFMTLKRYQQIWRFMHAADSAATPRKTSHDYDPLYKVRLLMDAAMDAWRSAYEPGAVVGVDESLLLFKGR